jgi:transposase
VETHDVPLTVAEAAKFFRVQSSTIRTWVRRYELEPVEHREHERGRPKLYRFGDLTRAERLTRQSPHGRRRNSAAEGM